MPDTDILRIGAEFDVAPVVLGAQRATTAFENLGTKVSAVGATSAQVDALTVAVNSLTASLERAAAGGHNFAGGMHASRGAMQAARLEVGVFEGSTGKIVRSLEHVAASSSVIAPLMQAAFPLFLVGAFVVVMDAVTAAINRAMDAMTGWDDAAKKAFADIQEANLQRVLKNIENAAKMRDANEIGLEGSKKEAVAIQNLSAEQKDYGVELGRTARSISEVQTRLDHLKSLSEKALVFVVSLGDMSKLNADIKIAEDDLARLQKEQKEAEDKVVQAPVDIFVRRRQLAADLAKESIRLEQAKAAAVKTVQDAEIAYEEDAAKKLYELHAITLEQETAALIAAEDKKIQVLRDSFDAQQRILKQRAAKGEVVAPEMTTLAAAREAAETKHVQTINDIRANGAREQFRLDEEAALHAISIDRRLAESADNLATHKAELAFRDADTPAEIQKAAAELTDKTTHAIENQIAALQRENDVISRGPKTPLGDLADPKAAEKFADNLAKIDELRTSEQTHSLDIQKETKTRTDAFYSSQLNDEIAAIGEEIRVSEEGERRITEGIRQQYEERQISSTRYVAEIVAAAEKEYDFILAQTRKEMDEIQKLAAAHVLTATQETKELERIWKQQQDAYQQMLNKITQAQQDALKKQQESIKQLSTEWGHDWTQMVNSVLTGQQTIGQALVKMAANMELQLIDKGIQKVVEKTATWLLQLLADHAAFFAQLLGVETAGDAAKIAKGAITATAIIQQQAAMAGAGAFASVASTVPWPPNPAPAIAAMGDAIATTESNLALVATFHRGGIVPANLQAGEMVLPAPISHAVQGAIPSIQNFNATMERGLNQTITDSSVRSSTNKTVTNHISLTLHNNGEVMTADDVTKAVKRAIRSGALP